MAKLNSTTITDLEITGGLVINGIEITPKSSATYTPSTSAQTIAAGQYLVGAQTIAAMPTGSATTPTNTTALSSTSTSLSGTTLTVQASVTPTVVAGYVSSGIAGTVKISGTVPTETKSASGSGDITPADGKLLSKVTVGAGSASIPNKTITPTFSQSGNIVTVTGSVTNTGTVSTAGWISSITSGSTSISTTNNANKYTIPAGSISMPSSLSGSTTATNTNAGTTITLSKSVTNTATLSTAGYIGTAPSGSTTITLTATDANLIASNIRSDVTIFGVTGNLSVESHTAYDGSYTTA